MHRKRAKAKARHRRVFYVYGREKEGLEEAEDGSNTPPVSLELSRRLSPLSKCTSWAEDEGACKCPGFVLSDSKKESCHVYKIIKRAYDLGDFENAPARPHISILDDCGQCGHSMFQHLYTLLRLPAKQLFQLFNINYELRRLGRSLFRAGPKRWWKLGRKHRTDVRYKSNIIPLLQFFTTAVRRRVPDPSIPCPSRLGTSPISPPHLSIERVVERWLATSDESPFPFEYRRQACQTVLSLVNRWRMPCRRKFLKRVRCLPLELSQSLYNQHRDRYIWLCDIGSRTSLFPLFQPVQVFGMDFLRLCVLYNYRKLQRKTVKEGDFIWSCVCDLLNDIWDEKEEESTVDVEKEKKAELLDTRKLTYKLRGMRPPPEKTEKQVRLLQGAIEIVKSWRKPKSVKIEEGAEKTKRAKQRRESEATVKTEKKEEKKDPEVLKMLEKFIEKKKTEKKQVEKLKIALKAEVAKKGGPCERRLKEKARDRLFVQSMKEEMDRRKRVADEKKKEMKKEKECKVKKELPKVVESHTVEDLVRGDIENDILELAISRWAAKEPLTQLTPDTQDLLEIDVYRTDQVKDEEKRGDIKFTVVHNRFDVPIENEMVTHLMQLQQLFSVQLPKMPKEYITRLVFDPRHMSVVIVKKNRGVIGGICFRPFFKQGFSEIVFCAITADEQVKGYGTHLMNHLKEFQCGDLAIYQLLTYADAFATGYFSKQGFSSDLSLDPLIYKGFIKDYEGATLMGCTLHPQIPYTQYAKFLLILRGIHDEVVKEKLGDSEEKTYAGIEHLHREYAGVPVPLAAIPGMEHVQVPELPHRTDYEQKARQILNKLKHDPNSWPFLEPVDPAEVPEYYEYIEYPIDLHTIGERLKMKYYVHEYLFLADLRRLFDNCYRFNGVETEYYKMGYSLNELCFKLVQDFFPDLPDMHPHLPEASPTVPMEE